MKHCYIFDYCSASIYHTEIPDDIEDVETYLYKKYKLKSSQISFIVTDEKLDIEDL